jgi:membrane AbrB-like protein
MPQARSGLARLPRAARWALLLILSALLAAGLKALAMPAPLLLGPMVAAILLASFGADIMVPMLPFNAAQGLVGCLIASILTYAAAAAIMAHWALFGTIAATTLAASAGLGWLLARGQVLPGSVAVWGLMPGAGAAMVLMAEDFGADSRLVAVMVYMRVVCVALTAALASRIFMPAGGVVQVVATSPIPELLPFLETIAIAAAGAVLGKLARLPAPAFLGPMILGVALGIVGWQRIELPSWLMALAYACIGWRIGLAFDRPILAAAARAVPKIIASAFLLIAVCGGLAALTVHVAGVDPLTAFLATSPGGIDSIAIIASSSRVDLAFVVAMQTLRVASVLVFGPFLARLAARKWRAQDGSRPGQGAPPPVTAED